MTAIVAKNRLMHGGLIVGSGQETAPEWDDLSYWLKPWFTICGK
jgi:hypothetical protein